MAQRKGNNRFANKDLPSWRCPDGTKVADLGKVVANLLPAVYPEWKNRYQGRISEDIFDMGDALIANYDKYSEV